MTKLLALLILTCSIGCFTAEGSTAEPPQQKQPIPDFSDSSMPDKDSRAISCNDPGSHRLEVMEDSIRQAKNVNLLVRERVRNVIHLPNQSDFNGFSLNWARKTKQGIEISVEYGSRYYFHKRFIFDCKQGDFFLTRIKVESFDKARPDKSTSKDVRVKPAVPIGKFAIAKYLTN